MKPAYAQAAAAAARLVGSRHSLTHTAAEACGCFVPDATQGVISSLQYNHSPGYHFNVCKRRPLMAILAGAAAMLREALPIKCLVRVEMK
jgi:Vasohibin